MFQLLLLVACKLSNEFSLPASEDFFSVTVNLPCSLALLPQISLRREGNYFKGAA